MADKQQPKADRGWGQKEGFKQCVVENILQTSISKASVLGAV